MKKITFLFLAFLGLNASLQAQELETILLAKEDASKLTEAYLKPATKGLIYSMNNGWYHTAKVHKKFGFDVTIGVSGSFAPSKDKVFDLTKLGLQSTTFTNNTSPTVAGNDDEPVSTLTFNGTVQGQNVSAEFKMAQGEGVDIVPLPVIQVGIGLPFKIEAMARFVPKVGSDDVKGDLLGIGLKKEITSWFGPLDKLPLHVSLLAGYTTMNVDYTIGDIDGDIQATNALTSFKLNSYTVQAIASINFPIINVYGGVGYNGGNTKSNMTADSDFIASYTTNTIPSKTVTENLGSNPLSLKSTAGSFNATAGLRLSMGFFKFFASYTMQEYNSANAGIAFSFR